MARSACWTAMDSPVKPANDDGVSGTEGARAPPQPLSPSGLTGGSMMPPARWTQMDSPVKPANDADGRGWPGVGPGAVLLLRRHRAVAVRAVDGAVLDFGGERLDVFAAGVELAGDLVVVGL